MYRQSTIRKLNHQLARTIARRQNPYHELARTVSTSPHHASVLTKTITDTFRNDFRTRDLALSALRHLSSAPPPNKESPESESKSSSASTANESKSEAKSDDKGKSANSKKTTADDGDKKASASTSTGGKKPAEDEGLSSSWIGQLALMMLVVLGLSMFGGRSGGKEISFQAFVWDLLEPGLVDRIEVINKSTARVYLKSPSEVGDSHAMTISDDFGSDEGNNGNNIGFEGESRGPTEIGGIKRPTSSIVTSNTSSTARANNNNSEAKFFFNIGTVETFERKLEAIQEDLGLEPDDFVSVTYVQESNLVGELLRHAPTFVLLGLGVYMMRNAFGSMGGMGGRNGGIFQVGKANPIVVKAGDKTSDIKFEHVAGLNEAKTEVMEFVDFLKHPARYEKLGAKIPKGALLVGPPGTGKTLLAKATAGEANVPFFSISGSDFIEMFVGVGPSRVRDLFAQARSNSPCIVFIDEIDAVGKARGRGGMAGGNDERENTLNALLVEMDGFSTSSGVVVLAGTNRADILDKALLRPGRFDRQINIDKPDMRGRYDIFMVHLRNIKLKDKAETIAKKLASLSAGFSGADIANICNEGALVAARNEKKAVELIDFENSLDRVIGGLEKKNKVISAKEREIIAHHEAGHAVCGWFLKSVDPLIKVSIIPRGANALGFAQYLPMDKVLQSEEQIQDFLIMALGGRVAEELCFEGKVTTGAMDDLQKITRAAYAKVTNFGMSDKVGKIYFPRSGEQGNNQFYKPYSEHTAEMIDAEVQTIIDSAYDSCKQLLTEKMAHVEQLAERLLEKEVLREEDLVEILGPRINAKPADYDAFVGRFDQDRKDRTGKSDGDGKAKDGAHTPPIPTDAAAAGKSWTSDGAGTEEHIPELC